MSMSSGFSMPQQAVIMAAGLGTRLRPLTETVPKPMLKVFGRPILEWTIEALPTEVREVILVVGYREEIIKNYFGEEWHGRKISYAKQQELAGTAMAVHAARKFLNSGRFFVINGDDLYDHKDLITLGGHEHAMLVLSRAELGRFSCMSVDAAGRFMGIKDACQQPHQHLVNTGAYVLDQEYFSLMPIGIGGGEFGLPHTISKAMADYQTDLVLGSFWFPIGFPADLELAAQALSEQQASSKPLL